MKFFSDKAKNFSANTRTVDKVFSRTGKMFRLNPDPEKMYLTVGVLSLVMATSCTVTVTPSYYPPFIKAAQQGNIAEAERLLRSGQMINQKSSIGNQTALHVAAAEGQDRMVEWLLAHEADPLVQDLNGKSPADYAREQGKPGTEAIIKNQIQQAQQESAAIQAGDKLALKELLSRDKRRYTLLHVLGQLGASKEAIREIESGSDVNARTALEMTPLHKAIAGGNVEIAKALIKAKADINACDIYNNTPLYYAAFTGNKEMVSLLVASGADKSIRSVLGNESPLDLAKRLDKQEVIPILEK